jgi:hypothetical protein
MNPKPLAALNHFTVPFSLIPEPLEKFKQNATLCLSKKETGLPQLSTAQP